MPLVKHDAIARADANRRQAALQCRMRAAAYALGALPTDQTLTWPDDAVAVTEELKLAAHHMAVADALATMVIAAPLIELWVGVLTLRRPDASDPENVAASMRREIEAANRALSSAYYELRSPIPYTPHAADAIRDLGLFVHDSWPPGRKLDEVPEVKKL